MPPLHPRCRCVIVYRESSRSTQPSRFSPTQTPPKTISTPHVLSSTKDIGTRRYALLQIALANAPNPKAVKVWEKFENQFKISQPAHKNTAYHESGVIYLDVDVAVAGDAIHTPFQVLFHESAHAIDFLNSVGDDFFSEHFRSGALFEAFKNDFDHLLKNEMSRLQSDKDHACESLCKIWRSQHSLKNRANFSDLLNAYTDGEHTLGAGHSKNYWLRGGQSAKSREIFAGFMDAALANATAFDLLKRQLPSTSKVFDEMLDELLKRGA